MSWKHPNGNPPLTPRAKAWDRALSALAFIAAGALYGHLFGLW